jgi:prephenate dehydratase
MKIFKIKRQAPNVFVSEKKNIAVQGYQGSFHQAAAEIFFQKKANLIYYPSFADVVKNTERKDEIYAGVMAIENSIAGSIIPNYTLLKQSNLHIIGEVYLKINQCLLANPGVRVQDIRQVYSHPMAIQQSLQFLDKFKWDLIETNDTALSAKYISQHKKKHSAAIASKISAKLYGLDILSANIQTKKNNYTRFLILQNADRAKEIVDANKASIYFSPKQLGKDLAKILLLFKEEKITLKNLQSIPVPDSNFEYGFHVDLLFQKSGQFFSILKKMKPFIAEIKIYGVYSADKLAII